MAVNEFNIGANEQESVRNTLTEASGLLTQAYQKYDGLLTMFKASGVKFEDLHKAVVSCFPNWPTREFKSGVKPMGIQAAMKEGFEGAILLNRFQAYYRKFDDYGVLKIREKVQSSTEQPSQATEQPSQATEQPSQATEQPSQATEQPAESGKLLQPDEDTKNSKPNQFQADSISLYLIGMAGTKQVQSSPDMAAALMTLAEGFGVDLTDFFFPTETETNDEAVNA